MKKIMTIFMGAFALLALVACGETTTTATTFDTTKNITVYTRDTTSGTRDAFFTGIGFVDAATDNGVLGTGYVEVDGNGSMITAIQNDPFGIGYISLTSLSSSGLNGLAFEGVAATEANVLNGTYTLARPFNYIVRADWTGMTVQEQIAEAFVAYMSTVDGKSTIQSNGGIVSIAESDPMWDDIKSQYPICEADNSGVTVVFGGSTSVEKVAEALSAEFSAKCGNFIAEHNHTGSGDGFKRTQGSEATGANAIHIGFASRAFKESEAAAEGTTGLICRDAVVIVLNGTNDTITDITASTTRQIYQGTLTLWGDLD